MWSKKELIDKQASGECLAQSGSLAVGAGQSVIDVNPLGLDPETEQSVALSGEVLLVGGASGVPDKQRAHDAPPKLGPTMPQNANGSGVGQCPTPPARASHAASARAAAVRKAIPNWLTPARRELPLPSIGADRDP
jgi:hypothetical protein